MIIRKIKIIYAVVVMLLFVFPLFIFAQTVKISSNGDKYDVGDTFFVEVKLDSGGQFINSLGGDILISEDIFAVSNIETGSSFISLWTDKPNYADGRISFSGGLPGGYSGSDGTVFSFILEAKKAGTTTVGFEKINAYLNDGKGTLVSPIELKPLQLKIKMSNSGVNKVYSPATDNIKPDSLTLKISRDPSVENNMHFVSFFAVDKGSGVLRYEVEEIPWIISIFGYKIVWSDVKNLQVLKYQNWISTVHVRAYDSAGNMIEETVLNYNNHHVYYALALLVVILMTFYVKKWYDNKSKS
jgi:hypothetical protein